MNFGLKILLFCLIWSFSTLSQAARPLAGALNINTDQEYLLDKYIRELEICNPDGFCTNVNEDNIHEVKSDTLQELFSPYTFLYVPYEFSVPKERLKDYSIPKGMYTVLVLNKNGKEQYVLEGSGNYEGFGFFLQANTVKVESFEDASKIWKAFCAIFRKPWSPDCLFPQETENSWKLCPTTTGFRPVSAYEAVKEEYYYLLELNEAKTVVSGKLVSNIVERRIENK